MNLLKGKTQKFISALRRKFDSLIWEVYRNETSKENFSQDHFINSILD